MKKAMIKVDTYFRNSVSKFIENEEGVGVIEVVLILVVLIGLVVVFKTKITSVLNSVFSKVTSGINQI